MGATPTTPHETIDPPTGRTLEQHRAPISLQAELEAVSWCRQRADACTDQDLRGILEHNLREKVGHALMLREWLRREDRDFSRQLTNHPSPEAPVTGSRPRGTGTSGPSMPPLAANLPPGPKRFTTGPKKEVP